MARNEFPKESIRVRYGDQVLISTDAAGASPANVQYMNGTAIVGGQYVVPTNSVLRFLGPDGVTSGLYVHVAGATSARPITSITGTTGSGTSGAPGATGATGAPGAPGATGPVGPVGPPAFAQSSTAPTSPATGDLWLDTSP